MERALECSKFVHGLKPTKRNIKADWNLVRKNAEQGNFKDIPSDIYCRYVKNLHHIAMQTMKPECRGDIEVQLLLGPTGSGKSHRANLENPQAYWKLSTNNLWCGYSGEKTVVIDDINGDIGVTYFKRWLDKYPCYLETEGGAIPAKFTKVVLTSLYAVEDWWQNARQLDIGAINRRIGRVIILEPRV